MSKLVHSRELLTIIHLFFLALAGYLSIAVGGIGLGEPVSLSRLVIASYLLLFLMLSFRAGDLKDIAPIIILVSLYLALRVYQSDQMEYLLSKFDGFIIAGIFVYLINRHGLSRYGERYVNFLIGVGIIIFIATILYKINFGFYDRQVRYFLNGPIVFGWMMGLLFFISLNEYFRKSNIVFAAAASIFLLGVLWSDSKGPVFALAATLFLYLILKKEYKKSFHTGLMVVFVVAAYSMFGYIGDKIFSSNSARLLTDTMLVADGSYMQSSSYSLRASLFHQSMDMFKHRPFLGVGVGNFVDHVTNEEILRRDLYYPHNFLFEVLAEHGVLGLSVFILLLIYLFSRLDVFSRIVFLFFALCLSFSGDMAYWRFLIFLPMALSGYQLLCEEKHL